MAKVKSKILAVLAVLMLGLLSLGLVGCGTGNNALSLSASTIADVAVGTTLDNALKGISLTYTDPNPEDGDETKTFNSVEEMREAGVSIMWSGSSEAVKQLQEQGTKLSISFAYKGYTITLDYKIV